MPRVASNLMSAIANYLKGQHYASTDLIAEALNESGQAIEQELQEMCADGIVIEVGQGYWALVPNDRRSH